MCRQSSLDDSQTCITLTCTDIATTKNSTARSLENKRNEVRHHESNGISPRTKAGKVLSIDSDDSCQAEIDSRAKESRAYGESSNIPGKEVRY